MNELGTMDNPHLVAPEDWETNGLEYGHYCRCSKCGLIGRSTYTFDFFADKSGDELVCETCTFHTPKEVAQIIDDNFDYIMEDKK